MILDVSVLFWYIYIKNKVKYYFNIILIKKSFEKHTTLDE
jgi:hypothetical protein